MHKVDDVDFGKHPLVSKPLKKDAFHTRPPLPRYSGTRNVQVVVNTMQQRGETDSLSLKLLTLKLVILLSLTRPSQSADLVSMNVDHCQYKPEGEVFVPSSLAKQSRQAWWSTTLPVNKQLCPVDTLQQYQLATMPLRRGHLQLFLATITP